jgi:hypothetical protein
MSLGSKITSDCTDAILHIYYTARKCAKNADKETGLTISEAMLRSLLGGQATSPLFMKAQKVVARSNRDE